MIRNMLKTLVFVLLVTFTLASCNNTSKKVDLTKGVAITNAQLYDYCQDTAKDGKRFSFIGYFSLQKDIQLDRNKTVNLNVYTAPEGKGTLISQLMLDFGKAANAFYAPEEFTLADLKVFDNNGKPLSYHDKIQFSFTLDLLTSQARKKMFYFTKDAKGFPEKHEVYAYPFVCKDIRIDKAN